MSHAELTEILLVEDSPTDAELILRALTLKQLANRVIWVKDGAEALDYLFCQGIYSDRSKGHPCFVFLDLKMPKVNGIEVLRRLKNNENTKAIPVVMLTSSAEEKDILEGYKLGVNSYIVKPVDFDQFMGAVSEVGSYWATLNGLPNPYLN
jgi:two-component system response regulator